jgi:hypothetical protein
MSKTDQLRRQREAHYAQQQEQASGAGGPAKLAQSPKALTEVAVAPVLAARRAKASADAEEGKCAVCGKVRALSNGLVSNHQKGLGKMCPGSRKEPA